MHSLTALVPELVSQMGYGGIFIWMAVSAFVPIPSEAVLPFAGALIVTQHTFNLHLLAFTGALGNLAGSIVAYAIGLRAGRGFFEKYGRYLLINRKDLDAADRWFAKHGEATVFFARMVPVVRAVISYPAGISRMHFGKFCLFSFLGGIPWCYFLAYIGMQLGERWDTLGPYFHKADVAIGVVFVIFIAIWLKHHLKREPEPGEPAV